MEHFVDAKKAAGFLIVAAVVVAWGIILFTREEKLPVGLADGVYVNDCCGRLVLKSGLGWDGDQMFVYDITLDKLGRSVVPTDVRVTASRQGLHISSPDHPLLLRLDSSPKPAWIDVPGSQGEDDKRFIRQPG